jgi:hypothetical protein
VAYNLIRTTPDGEERELGSHDTILNAAAAAMSLLRSEGLATHVESRWYASHLSGLPLGTDAVHGPSKHMFRIERAAGGEQL